MSWKFHHPVIWGMSDDEVYDPYDPIDWILPLGLLFVITLAGGLAGYLLKLGPGRIPSAILTAIAPALLGYYCHRKWIVHVSTWMIGIGSGVFAVHLLATRYLSADQAVMSLFIFVPIVIVSTLLAFGGMTCGLMGRGVQNNFQKALQRK